jgi:hypothetical protein
MPQFEEQRLNWNITESQIKNPNFYNFNLDDKLFTLCSFSSLAVHDDKVGTFQELVLEF